ncbi:MAG: hypothetical protein CL943_00995 [Candidatus Diapherotrites archaeon]|uniref:Stage II sporulation protein M n=1 Tax=Candidatus Iainarchaeum sp. TaxID=3101447 RepID=A0A2D6M0B7_9ARCH|nr:hypothetical protein [Candidatus Diapherotrites archaeon]|tara:strand:+ start:1909 stop:2790 length:882 start_codon:yes stop_codon:yes gene_type:complete
MVLEAIVSSKELMKHPLVMLFISIIVSAAGLWIAYWTFPGSSSILGIAFVTIALVPLMHSIFVKEEAIEAESDSWTPNFLERHFTVVKIYAWFFIGLIISYAFWYSFLPIMGLTDMRNQVFEEQENALGGIEKLKSRMTGNATLQGGPCGKDVGCWFQLVFYNNTFVMLLSVLFSFIYGAGAVFLIGWNASVIGVVIGKEVIHSMAISGNFLQSFATGLYRGLGLLPHGLPEALGYFFGAIAGGIIGVAIIKEKHRTHEFAIIAKDALITIVIALVLLFIGALIEAMIIVGSL